MDRSTGVLGQQRLAGRGYVLGDAGNPLQSEFGGGKSFVHHPFAYQRELLGMPDDRYADASGILQRPPASVPLCCRSPVVGDRDATVLLEFAHLGQAFTAPIPGLWSRPERRCKTAALALFRI